MSEQSPPPKVGDDLQMMQSPEHWPHDFVLPLKRVRDSGWDCGLLVQVFPTGKRPITFWLPNKTMFDKITVADVKAGKKLESESDYQQLLDDGWMVD